MIKNFRSLNIYQRAKELAHEMFLLSQSFPKYELYELGNQLRRASASTVLNIAEGNAQQYVGKEINQLNVALGSCAEVRAILDLLLLRGLVDNEKYQKFDGELEEFQKILFTMIKNLRLKENE